MSDQSREYISRQELERKRDEIEAEYVGREPERPNDWGGYVVKPSSIEFWCNSPVRFHERFAEIVKTAEFYIVLMKGAGSGSKCCYSLSSWLYTVKQLIIFTNPTSTNPQTQHVHSQT